MTTTLKGHYIITHKDFPEVFLSPTHKTLAELSPVKVTWEVTPVSSNVYTLDVITAAGGVGLRLDRHGHSIRDGAHPALNKPDPVEDPQVGSSQYWIIEQDPSDNWSITNKQTGLWLTIDSCDTPHIYMTGRQQGDPPKPVDRNWIFTKV